MGTKQNTKHEHHCRGRRVESDENYKDKHVKNNPLKGSEFCCQSPYSNMFMIP